MALSRIWTAFIIIALLVAAGRFVFQPGQQNLFGSLVTGKNSDTVAVRTVDSAAIPATVLSQPESSCMGKREDLQNRRHHLPGLPSAACKRNI